MIAFVKSARPALLVGYLGSAGTMADPGAESSASDDALAEDEVGVGFGPRCRITEERRQAALDAAALLQMRRSEIASRVARGDPCGAELVALTKHDSQAWVRREARGWHEVLTVHAAGTVGQLRGSLPDNRELIRGGLRMVSVWNWDGLKPEARRLLAGERVGRHLLGVGPVQMRLVDRRMVLVDGPAVDEQPTLMVVTARECLAAAWLYWHAAVASSYPADEDEADRLDMLTPRQRQIAALLAVDTRDEAIAETVGASVRTVRADIANLMEVLGVRSRFAAGDRFRSLLADC